MASNLAWRVERAIAAWQEAQAGGDDLPPTNGETVDEVIDSLVQAIMANDAKAETVQQRRADLKIRADRFNRRSEELRHILADLMGTLNQRQCELAEFTVSRTQGRDAVIITDPAKLPGKYVDVRTEFFPSKARILADLREGVVIEGAELKPAGHHITIRTK